ncbi:hypothetical protein [Paraburkholderia caribensis]|uniref:hypothetical protein n=1 Tax=Paraburkholderia caribensis TaxID=75105 RepID=UPI0034D1E0A7
MHQSELTQAITPDRAHSVEQAACPRLCHATFRPTHVGTDVAAVTLLVEPETMLKSHSIHGHYAGIRPVRLPNRKLAWPIAEIEKLFETHHHTTSVKEAA